MGEETRRGEKGKEKKRIKDRGRKEEEEERR